MDKAFTNYLIEERSYVSYVKREIHLEVSNAHFSETKVGEIDIIVSELTSNLIKHAGSGEVLYRTTNVGGNSIFEIICIDKGPGMADVSRMMKDGVSTTQTLGHGLGAVERLSSFAQFYSLPKWGTIAYAVVSTREEKFVRKTGLDVAIRALCVCKPRETACGDGYGLKQTDESVKIFFGDGLGHGEQAKAAVDAARNVFMESNSAEPSDIIRQMHEKVRRTRGLVTAIAVFDRQLNRWKLCGVGNIVMRLYNGIEYKNYMSYNGTVGLNIPNSVNNSTFAAEKNQHLIMCSDGIRSRWDLNSYPSIFKYDCTILAAALYRDFTRGNDDASVLIAKVS